MIFLQLVTKPIKIVLIEVTKPTKIVLIEVTKPTKIVLIRELAMRGSLFLLGRKLMMKWINVNEKYLDYLRANESRIPKTDYGNDKYKPFFGVLFEVDDLYYITQVSHPQPRHNSMRQQKDFFKVYDPHQPNRLIAVVNLNYMFPIPKEETTPFEKSKINTYRTFQTESEKSRYIDLLDKELIAINSMNIGTKASELYKFKYDYPENIRVLGGKTGTTDQAGCCLILYDLDENTALWVVQTGNKLTSESESLYEDYEKTYLLSEYVMVREGEILYEIDNAYLVTCCNDTAVFLKGNYVYAVGYDGTEYIRALHTFLNND